jgi:hypothetical protein
MASGNILQSLQLTIFYNGRQLEPITVKAEDCPKMIGREELECQLGLTNGSLADISWEHFRIEHQKDGFRIRDCSLNGTLVESSNGRLSPQRLHYHSRKVVEGLQLRLENGRSGGRDDVVIQLAPFTGRVRTQPRTSSLPVWPDLLDHLRRKHTAHLVGPAGCGKSWLARRLRDDRPAWRWPRDLALGPVWVLFIEKRDIRPDGSGSWWPSLGGAVISALDKALDEPSATRPAILNAKRLFEGMNKAFDLGELQTLCLKLGIDYEALSGDNKPEKIGALIQYCERHGREGDLLNQLSEMRPKSFTANPAPGLASTGMARARQIVADHLDATPRDVREFNRTLVHVLSQVARETERSLVCVFDEFDEWYPCLEADLLDNLQALCSQLEDIFHFVVVTRRPLDQLRTDVDDERVAEFNALFADHAIRLGCVPGKEFSSVWYEVAPGRDNDSAAQALYTLSGGHPGLARQLYDWLSDEGVQNQPAIWAERLSNVHWGVRPHTWCHRLWHGLTPAQRQALVARLDGAPLPLEIERELREESILREDGQLFSPVFEQCLAEFRQHL